MVQNKKILLILKYLKYFAKNYKMIIKITRINIKKLLILSKKKSLMKPVMKKALFLMENKFKEKEFAKDVVHFDINNQ
jgi:hypothetical protein